MATLTVSAADEKRVKAMGFLSNKGTDNFSGRIITVSGKITAAQQRCIAEAAEKFGNGAVTFTTRLTIEVQGIPYDQIEAFQAYIAREGLTTGGTGSRCAPWWPARAPPVSTGCWTPSLSARRSIAASTKAITA